MTTSATGSVDYISDWTDIVNTTAVTTAGSGQGNVTTATTTTIITTPASGSSRAVRSAMISNRHGSTSNTIQLFKTVGAASYAISKPLVLLAGETVRFSDEGFCFVGNACELEVTSATTSEQLKSNATTGVMQIVGPAAGTTRVVTIPDANATMARTDAAQTFTGTQTFSTISASTIVLTPKISVASVGNPTILLSANAGIGGLRQGNSGAGYPFLSYNANATTTTYTYTYAFNGPAYMIDFGNNTGSGNCVSIRCAASGILGDNISFIEAARFKTTGIESPLALNVKDTTNATTTTDGSLQTNGGLSVVKSAIIGNHVKIVTAGYGIFIKEGSNARMGTATLSSGTATVSTTAVSATSRIFLTIQSIGTVTSPKSIAVTARVAGTSFTITSSDYTDTSVVAWMIVDPA